MCDQVALTGQNWNIDHQFLVEKGEPWSSLVEDNDIAFFLLSTPTLLAVEGSPKLIGPYQQEVSIIHLLYLGSFIALVGLPSLRWTILFSNKGQTRSIFVYFRPFLQCNDKYCTIY